MTGTVHDRAIAEELRRIADVPRSFRTLDLDRRAALEASWEFVSNKLRTRADQLDPVND